MLKFFDAHSHLNLSQFDADREEQIKKMKELGVGTITVGVDYETSKFAADLAGRCENIWACVGQHPTDTDETFEISKYRELAQNIKVVAIGETGLDYFREVSPEMKSKQKELFLKQVELAIELNKPLMIHARPSKGTMDAYEDVLDILESYENKTNLRGNFHFFVGDIAIAQRALDLGFTMSFDGPITFARDYDEVVKFIPLESVLSETDAPFAAPAPYRGKRCEPIHVVEIVKKIAEIKNEDFEKTREILTQNATRVFGIDMKA